VPDQGGKVIPFTASFHRPPDDASVPDVTAENAKRRSLGHLEARGVADNDMDSPSLGQKEGEEAFADETGDAGEENRRVAHDESLAGGVSVVERGSEERVPKKRRAACFASIGTRAAGWQGSQGRCYSLGMTESPRTLSRHPRSLGVNRYVYAVLSRRARGISVGINLNPDKVCNFDCIYCQVDRTTPPLFRDVDEGILLEELESVLKRANDGGLFREFRFDEAPGMSKRLSDIAFAGDGEPTTYPRFRELLGDVIALKKRLGLEEIKISVLTNCTVLHRPSVRDALTLLDNGGGEIWAKLDAGTEAYYERVCVPGGAKFSQILSNILEAARVRPLVIQSLFLRHEGAPPSPEEIEGFCGRLTEIAAQGGSIRLVQVYTVARRPALASVAPLSDAEVDALAETVRRRTALEVEAYYGSTDW